jgi:Tat protein secretion system quality control protein TatD with DNase activity
MIGSDETNPPAERLLVETDAPYLSPQPGRADPAATSSQNPTVTATRGWDRRMNAWAVTVPS